MTGNIFIKHWLYLLTIILLDPSSSILRHTLDTALENGYLPLVTQVLDYRMKTRGHIRASSILVEASEDEERLVRDLFRDYNKLIRPVEHSNQTVEVQVGLSFVQLINVNEKNQVMTTNVWQQFHWKDYQLKWEPAQYGGIYVLRLPPDKVWRPDIVLFNNADGNYEARYKSNVLIHHDSMVEWIPPAIFQSTCKIDVTYFPFDQQRCEMIFGSWTYTGNAVTLKFYKDKSYMELSDYWKSGTWDLVNVPGCLQSFNGSKWGVQTESQITYYVEMRRKTLFYTVNLILPAVLISFLCLLVFLLPAEAGEKITLGISILLSLVVFLLLVSKILPPTSLVIPLIAKYLLFTFAMNCLSVLVTVVIINFNFRGPRTHTMPNWIRIVFLEYLPIILRMKRPKKTRLRWMTDMHGSSPPCDHLGESIPMEPGLDPYGAIASQLSPAAARATEAIEFVAEHLKCEDEYVQIREDWKYVAMTIDRLQLYLFSLGTTVGTLYIFLAAPHLFETVDQDKLIQLQNSAS